MSTVKTTYCPRRDIEKIFFNSYMKQDFMNTLKEQVFTLQRGK